MLGIAYWRRRQAAAASGVGAEAAPRPAPVTRHQFALFRWLFGLYLAAHCAWLIPWGSELFSRDGIFPDPTVNPLHGLFPNPLALWDAPAVVTGWLVALTALALLFAAGVARRAAAVALWFGLACLFNRNNLIANPSLPYVGVLLLITALVPPGEGWSLGRKPAADRWAMPASVFAVAWVLMAAGYAYSGLVKLASPSWVDGSALAHVLDNPLARSGPLRQALLAAPVLLQVATWGGLAVELLAAPLSLFRGTRPWWWLAAVGLQLGILAMVAFADLTAGMLMLHLFTLDPRWLPARRPAAGARHLVLYDGVCGLCDRAVQFLLAEDREAVLHYAPLQGEAARELLARGGRAAEGASTRLEATAGEPAASAEAPADAGSADADPGTPETMILVRDAGSDNPRLFVRSGAVLATLDLIGGVWRPVSWLRAVPAPVRDAVYRWIATHRYRWFGRYDVCKLPPSATRERFL